VYNPSEEQAQRPAAEKLLGENRVDFVTPADYSEGRALDRIVHTIIDKIAAEVELTRLCE
jgi:hypothetical protein